MRGGRWRVGTLVLAGLLAGCGEDVAPEAEAPPPPPATEAPAPPPPPEVARGNGSLGFVRQYDEAGRDRTSGAWAGSDGSFVVQGATARQVATDTPGVPREAHVSLLDHYDREGQHLWTLELPEGVLPSEVAVGAERIVVAGSYHNTPQLAGTTLPRTIAGRGIFLLTLTRQGAPVAVRSWVVRVGRAKPHDTEVDVRHLRLDASGGAVLVGTYRGALDLGTGELPQEDPALRADSTFVARLTPQGQVLWARSLRTDVWVHGVAVAASGDVALGGITTRRDTDLGEGGWGNAADAPFVAGLAADTGRTRWRHVLAGVQGTLMAAVETPGGFTFAGHYARGSASFAGTPLPRPTGADADLMLLRVDAAGTPVWARRYGGPADERWPKLVADAQGRLTLSLGASGGVNLGGETLTAPEGARQQVFVAAYDDTGGHLWSRVVPNLGGTDLAGHALLPQPGGDVVVVTSLAQPGQLDGRALTPIAGEDLLLLQLRR